MRKRLAFIWTPLVIALALMLPATATATSYGQVSYSNFYCSGNNTVNATFKVKKYVGTYATKLTMKLTGQGYHNGSWHNEYNFGTFSKTINTSGQAAFTRTAWFQPAHSGKHRIVMVGKIWNGGYMIASGTIRTPGCS
jgi:hypothetical protein